MMLKMKNAYKLSSLTRVLRFLKIYRYAPDDLLLMQNLAGVLGFRPGELALYHTAFIHRSASQRDKRGQLVNNERLEYLGDAILDAVVADYLYHMYPQESEGFLTQVRSRIVNGDKLSEIASSIGIDRLLVSQANRNQARKSLMGDAFEALIGAIYLDKGYAFASRFIVNRVLRKHVNLTDLIATDTNYKSQLIEWAQREKRDVRFLTEGSDESSKVFVAWVVVDNERMGRGEGVSKKIAEQEAARETILQLGAL